MQMKQIASTTARMFAHLDRLHQIRHGKTIRPITIHLSITDRCNLDCPFCSVKNRKGDELSYKEATKIINVYGGLRIKSIELTGGGEPTLHSRLSDVIHYAKDWGLDVGLITNGVELNNVDSDALKELTWLRISLSGIDFGLEQKYFDIDVDRLPFTGCSYVFTVNTTPKHLKLVEKAAKHLGSRYVRIVPNCYTPQDIEWGRKVIPNAIHKYPRMFMQIKDYSIPEHCYWRYIKPFVNSDGYIYHCSTCALFAGRFSEPWRVAHWTEIDQIYKGEPSSFDTSKCKLCFYSRQNELLHDVMIDVKHPSFI